MSAHLVSRAAALTGRGRALLGVAGAPGVGKSTLAEALAATLGPERAVVVAMDGFHLANSELHRVGRTARKGAPDTFDADGFLALLVRLATPGPRPVYAPVFDRTVNEPVAAATAVAPEVPLVIVEGNYLLLRTEPWARIRPLLTECWFVRVPEQERERRLIARHERFGADPERARAHALGSDAANAALVGATADRADLVVRGIGRGHQSG